MLRTLTRRGVSVLVTAALIGGGVALGTGTSAAQEVPTTGSSSHGVAEQLGLAVLAIGRATG